MKLVPNYVILIGVLAVAGGLFAYGHHVGTESCQLDQTTEQNRQLNDALAREKQVRQELEDTRAKLRDVSQELQDALGRKEVIYVDNIRTITREVQKPVYGTCAVPPSGVQVLSESAERLNASRRASD